MFVQKCNLNLLNNNCQGFPLISYRLATTLKLINSKLCIFNIIKLDSSFIVNSQKLFNERSWFNSVGTIVILCFRKC